MKPSPLARPRWRSAAHVLGVLCLLLAACAGTAPSGDDTSGTEDPPPKIKLPPQPKDGSSTVAGCDGVPESGECRDGVAVFCDIANAELRRKDCKALGKSCVIDAVRGATCETVTPGGGGSGTSTCDTGVTLEGSCGGAFNATATWCDVASSSTIVWNCADDDLACTVDGCGVGAYCCPTATTPPPPPPSNECPTLGFYGECGGAGDNTARWCNGETLVERVCSGGQTCQLDACASGAFCCNPPEAPVDECATIGTRGVCTAAGNPRWCSNGTVQEVSCTTGTTCQMDTCGSGAFCCTP